ncbi:putative bifunctional diguanylate cyclase/phosphodiesterase [Aeromicrobium ginsengisoli]|uniref:EAL domain-containing protein n=1 Tax=Aeromicrobium ginsengisoli TaxID=363867 RepID=A0A5M4FFC4_9ACTN|nr:EAL domain-containing protein [Aeromicrobium ginsengisoli]KAA1397994.1 EAL domain-containing protein [Aeromicrobium ginsengisoli]
MTRIYLVAGAIATALYLLGPTTAMYDAIGASCVVAILIGVRINRPVKVLPWYLMAAGQSAWVAGDLFFDLPNLVRTTPSASDLAYLTAYPLLIVGLAVLVHSRRPTRDTPGLIDSAIVVLGLGLLSWVLVADPIVDDTTISWVDRAIAAAYPAGDIVLLALVVRLVSVPGARSPAFRLLVAALVPLITADTVFAMELGASESRVLDVMWLSSYLLWGGAALHPTMAQLSTPSGVRTAPFTARRLVALGAAVLVAPVLLIAQLTHGLHVDTWTIVLGASVLSMLVVARMAYNIEEIRATARQRDQLRSDLFHEASHDSLTGTANGPYMRQQIRAALRRGRRDGSSVGLLVVDIDEFDEINDRFGHGVGDLVLRAVAQRLRSLVRDVDVVARLGGDQFVILLDSVASDHDAMILAAHLLPTINQPVDVSGHSIPITASIGATTSMDGGTEPDQLLHEANVAIRRAKISGRGRIEVFDNRLRSELQERATIEADLCEALEAGRISLHYQPVVAVHTEIVEGYEAQLRWDHPARGLLGPEAFLPIAATSDLICELDRWTLREATAELSELTAADPDRFADVTVSVSISGRMLAAPDLLQDVDEALSASGLAPHRLTVGVTEMALVDVPNAMLPLSALRHAGVFVSIDDFGTGRTPIGQIQHLPADAIKIHSTLINSAEPGARDLLALLVNAAHGSGLLVVAEGVEDAGQLVDLRQLECDSAQGLYSASADPTDEPVIVHPSARGVPRLRIVPDQ